MPPVTWTGWWMESHGSAQSDARGLGVWTDVLRCPLLRGCVLQLWRGGDSPHLCPSLPKQLFQRGSSLGHKMSSGS